MLVDVSMPMMTWAQRLAHSITSKVPAPMNNKTISRKRIELESNTIYENSDIKSLLRVHKVESIIQQTLLTDSVLFELMSKDFEGIVEVYQVINQQIGEVDGFTPVSKFSTNNRGNFLLAVNFINKDDCFEAIENGFKLNDNNYFGSSTTNTNKDNTAKLIWIKLSLIPAKRSELLIMNQKRCLYSSSKNIVFALLESLCTCIF